MQTLLAWLPQHCKGSFDGRLRLNLPAPPSPGLTCFHSVGLKFPPTSGHNGHSLAHTGSLQFVFTPDCLSQKSSFQHLAWPVVMITHSIFTRALPLCHKPKSQKYHCLHSDGCDLSFCRAARRANRNNVKFHPLHALLGHLLSIRH